MRGLSRALFLLFLIFPFSANAVLLDRVLAVVNGEIITLSDVQIALQFHLTDASPSPGASSEEQKLAQDKTRRQLIDRKLLLAEARKFNIQTGGTSEDEVRSEIGRIQSVLTAAGYDAALKRWGLPESDLVKMIREKITVDKFLSFRIQFFVVVSPDALQKYYQEHQAEYQNLSFEEAQGEIEKTLSAKEAGRMLEEYLERLRGSAVIQINPL